MTMRWCLEPIAGRTALLAPCLLAACIATPMNRAPRAPTVGPTPTAFQYLADAPHSVRVSEPRKDGDGLTCLTATLPRRDDLPGVPESVDIELFLPPGPRAPVIVILPILGGRYEVERGLTQYMAAHGFAAAMLRRRGKLLDPKQGMEQARAAFLGAVIDVRRLLDWLATRADVDASEIGLFGISRGGIVACLAAAVEPRVGAVALALAGGNLPDILARSEEPGVIEFRDAQVKRLGSFEAFHRRAQELLRDIDPLEHAHRLDARRVLMMNGLFDAVIPRANHRALWHAAGEPALYEFPVGHYGIVAFLWYCRAKALEHFRAILIQKGNDPTQ